MADDWNTQIINEFRANSGQLGGNFEGAPMTLLTTTGAKSGQPRTAPMMYMADESDPKRIFVFASKAGAPSNPDWYYNLRANPGVTVEVGAEKYEATAVEVTGAERDEIYAEQARRYPGFGGYQAATSRVIPVIALVRP
jgi:deazaflavin-dependent oxidoreductase (nitroreductase family)